MIDLALTDREREAYFALEKNGWALSGLSDALGVSPQRAHQLAEQLISRGAIRRVSADFEPVATAADVEGCDYIVRGKRAQVPPGIAALRAIVFLHAELGRPPYLSEIQERMGMESKNGARARIARLAMDGRVSLPGRGKKGGYDVTPEGLGVLVEWESNQKAR